MLQCFTRPPASTLLKNNRLDIGAHFATAFIDVPLIKFFKWPGKQDETQDGGFDGVVSVALCPTRDDRVECCQAGPNWAMDIINIG